MMNISDETKALARHTASALLAETPPVFRYWDDNRQSSIHVMEAHDRPSHGVTTYATIGLFEHPLYRDGEEFGVRTEFVGACNSGHDGFGNALATAAFCIINSKWFCAPGIVFPDVMAMHELSDTMTDLYFTYPFHWEDRLMSKEFGAKKVAWLLAMPVSRKETAFAHAYGPDKLEELFIRERIDVFDLLRPSIV